MQKESKKKDLSIRRIIREVIIPLQVSAGMLILFTAAGGADLGLTPPYDAVLKAGTALLLIAGAALYK